MFSEVVAGSAIAIFPLVGLMVFFTFMTLVYLWAFDPRKKQYFANVAASILRD
jgi:cbb3-type cytochrome oxidase subunit 3